MGKAKNFSLFPGNQNEQKSLKPLAQKMIGDFGCGKFIFCSDSGLASENNRLLNHTMNRAYIVTQSIKKLSSEYREPALDRKGFRRLSKHKLVDLDHLRDKDYDQLFYKEEPYKSKKTIYQNETAPLAPLLEWAFQRCFVLFGCQRQDYSLYTYFSQDF